MALENTETPTGLIFTRQNVDDVVDYKQALNAQKGAYAVNDVANPHMIVVANGSEVSTAIEAANLVKSKIRIVSVISEGLFREQSSKYQQEILPANVPKFGVTAGLAVNLLGLVGDIDRIHSLEHFGFSAPYEKLDEEFGFTPKQLSKKLEKALK
jgi:transketolase